MLVGYPDECLAHEGLLRYSANVSRRICKLDGAGHFRRFWQIVLPLVRPMVAVQALWAFMGPLETISSLVSCFVRKNTLLLL